MTKYTSAMKKTLFLLSFLISVIGHAQDLSAIYEKVSPAVVQVQTKEKTLVGTGSKKRAVTEQGIGSGVLISSDGLVLTAAHVVQTAEDVKVVFKDNETIPAKIIATEQMADVALLKLTWPPSDKNIHIPKLGDSDKVKVGEQIFVIGSPFGLSQSLSSGYISGRHIKKSLSHNLTLMEFFQTDAAINTGNSGGPMFNMKGEVIGIVSYILTESGGFEGLGFAATSNIARKLLLDEKGVWFGVDAMLITESLAKILNVPQKGGILVQKVAELSPGFMMGLKGGSYEMVLEKQKLIVGGDIILSMFGEKIENEKDLLDAHEKIRSLKDKDVIDVTVLRGGKIVKLSYTINK